MIGYFIALLTIAVVSLGTAWIEGKSASLGLSMFMQASLVTVGGMAMIAMVLLLAAMQMVEDVIYVRRFARAQDQAQPRRDAR